MTIPYRFNKDVYKPSPSIERMIRKVLSVYVPSAEIVGICRRIEIEKNESYETGIWSAKQLIQKELDRRKENVRIIKKS